jgi:hypothetical protein
MQRHHSEDRRGEQTSGIENFRLPSRFILRMAGCGSPSSGSNNCSQFAEKTVYPDSKHPSRTSLLVIPAAHNAKVR